MNLLRRLISLQRKKKLLKSQVILSRFLNLSISFLFPNFFKHSLGKLSYILQLYFVEVMFLDVHKA